MIRQYLYVIILLLWAGQAQADGLWIEIRDRYSLETLKGVSVQIVSVNGNKTLFSKSSDSLTEIKDIVYPFRITCSHTGYETSLQVIQKNAVSKKNGKDYLLILMDRSNTLLNQLVVTGQITPVMARQSIYKVNTVGLAEIGQRGAVSLNDVLNFEMNNFVSNDNILGSSVNIGGIGGQNVKVLINGIPVMGRENGNIDMGQLNLNNIKRIEMIQGPMSVMYGSNALGGVINLISATPKKAFSINARSYFESIGRYNFSGSVGFNKKKHQLQVSMARNFFGGWAPEDSIDRFQLWKPKTQYTGDLQYWFNTGKWKLNYFANLLSEKISNKGEPIISPYEGYAFDEYYRTRRMMNAFSANVDLNTNNKLAFTNSFQTYKRIKNRFRKDLVTLEQFETPNVGDQDSSNFFDINLRGNYSTKSLKNTELQVGYEYTFESGTSYKLVDEQQRVNDLGIYASALYRYKKLSLQPSCRVTFSNRYDTYSTPAVHAKLDLNERTQLRGSYARGFRAPTLKEMYLQFVDQNHTILGNPDLKPESGDHFQLGLDHQQTIKKWNVGYSLNAYQNSIHNLIALAVYNNHGVLRRYDNIENYRNWILNAKGSVTRANLTLQAGAGMIYVEKSNITPEHIITEFSYTSSYLFKRYQTTLNLNYKYNSRQPVITVNQEFLYTSPLHVANFSFQRPFFKKRLIAQAGIKNLFNLQSSTLSGNINAQTGGHTSSGALQVFPARSIFMDLSYSL